MKTNRIPILLSILLVSFGLLTLFITAVGRSIAAPASQEGIQVERDEEASQSESLPLRDTGGPDGFGYTFIDSNETGGPIYSFVEISSTGTTFPLPDSSLAGPLSLGFDFNFYGTNYSEVSAASNGYLWFDNGTTHAIDSSPDCPLPNTLGNENYIAALHDDLDGQQNAPNGMGYYQAFAPSFCPYGGYGGACFIVEWDGTYHDATTDDLTFQIILFDDHNFLIQFEDVGIEAGSASTTGIENSDASIGLTYACDEANSITDTLAVLYEAPAVAILDSSVKTGPSVLTTGMPITYSLVLYNSGTASSTSTLLTDTIPPGTTYVPSSVSCVGGTGSCAYVPGEDAVTWAGSIDVGETVTVEFAVDTSSVTCGNIVDNVADLVDPGAFGSPYTLNHSTSMWDQVLAYDFEANDGGFVPGFSGFPGPSDWEWGVPTFPAGLGAVSGSNVWATVLDGPHNNNSGNSLLTKTVDLSGFPNTAQLTWAHYLQANNSGFDFGVVRVNGDTVFDSFGMTDTPDWTSIGVPIGDYVGGSAEIVYDFFSTAGTNDHGWYIDDVSIVACDIPDNPVFDNSNKIAPASVPSGDAFTYTVNITNSGGVDAMNTLMTDTIPSGTTYVPGSVTNGGVFNSVDNQIEWTGYVTAGESISVSFMVTANLSIGEVNNTAVITHPDVTTPTLVSAVTTVTGSASYPICEDFEIGSLPGYFTTETTSAGAANGRVAVTTAFPHIGSYALHLDTDCDNCGGLTQQAAIMSVDLAGQSDIAFSFWVFEHFDEEHPEDGVFISDDGGTTWALIQSLHGFPASYQEVVIDMDAAVATAGMSYVDGFLIKFQSLDGATIPGNDGYSFDDICLEPGVPEIDVNPTALTSTQPTNQVMTETFILANVGNAALNWNITEADTDCGSPTAVPWADAQPASGTTGGGSSTSVDVAFDSTGLSPAVYDGLLCINSDDPISPTVSVSLTLEVVAVPVIEVDPDALSSSQDTDTQVVQTFTISNTGNADLNWDIVEQDTQANFGSTVGSDAIQVSDPAAAGNLAMDTAETATTGEGADLQLLDGFTPEYMPDGFVLYDNGPLVNGPGAGVGGADESILQTVSLSMNTLGFGNAAAADDRTADDFTIPAGDVWELDEITFFSYQTGSALPSTIFSASLQIWDGEPGNGGTVIWGDTSTNVLLESDWSYVYRTTEATTGTATDRPIMANIVDLGGLILPAGTYWLDWQTDGSLASGPFAPPISINGVLTTGNGLVTGDNGATWAPALDSGSNTQQGFPFIIEGTPGCISSDIPWASASPTSGTTTPGNSTDVDVTFDSAGLSTGVYNGSLCVNSDDPITPLVKVPLTLTVTGPGNTPPIAFGDSYITARDVELNVPAPGVLGNDTDADSDPLTAVLDVTTSNGFLVFNADGSFTYTPDPGFTGADGFTYHANDGTADSNTVTVDILVEETDYVLYLPYSAKGPDPLTELDSGTDATAAGENWLLVTLTAFPMMVGMLVLYRRKDRFEV